MQVLTRLMILSLAGSASVVHMLNPRRTTPMVGTAAGTGAT